ncbi:uncharacterized protein [Nicotiana sylvestris]|uniref:uncharacterized protein n=1 Tax=Nicotiana sylvestris TaxID=4096 RepID=UPI00388C536B
MEVPKQASWLVRKLFIAREWWDNDITTISSFVQNGRFSIQKAYFHANPRYPKLHWKVLVMLTGILPKQQFILWMAIQRRLARVDRLAKWGIQNLWTGMLEWLSYQRKVESWEYEVQWLTTNVNKRNPRKTLLGVVFAAVVYHIWMERNERRFHNQRREVKDRTKDIVMQVHITGQKKCKWTPILSTLNSYPNCNS